MSLGCRLPYMYIYVGVSVMEIAVVILVGKILAVQVLITASYLFLLLNCTFSRCTRAFLTNVHKLIVVDFPWLGWYALYPVQFGGLPKRVG